jgi:hypothetical protein
VANAKKKAGAKTRVQSLRFRTCNHPPKKGRAARHRVPKISVIITSPDGTTPLDPTQDIPVTVTTIPADVQPTVWIVSYDGTMVYANLDDTDPPQQQSPWSFTINANTADPGESLLTAQIEDINNIVDDTLLVSVGS